VRTTVRAIRLDIIGDIGWTVVSVLLWCWYFRYSGPISHMARMSSSSGEACCKLLYPVTLLTTLLLGYRIGLLAPTAAGLDRLPAWFLRVATKASFHCLGIVDVASDMLNR